MRHAGLGWPGSGGAGKGREGAEGVRLCADVLVVGGEDPAFASIGTYIRVSQNDAGRFVFGSRNSGFPEDRGLFTGNDPSQHTVVRLRNTLFGRSVLDIGTELHSINNAEQ